MSTIDSWSVDPQFKFLVANQEGGEGILKCFACGSCTARCPEMQVKPSWNPRVIIRKALLGLKDEVLNSEFLWICSAHSRCLDKCPQKVNVKQVMNAVRNTRLLDEYMNNLNEKKPEHMLDPNMKYAVVNDPDGKDLYECFSCGTCTAGCPERELDSLYSSRKVIKQVVVGLKEPVFENKFVEICSMHHRCFTECPQGVEIPKLMNAIRSLALKEGYQRIHE